VAQLGLIKSFELLKKSVDSTMDDRIRKEIEEAMTLILE